MPKPKKRLSKNAKAALKAVTESKLLAAKSAEAMSEASKARAAQPAPRTAVANKLRPEKKRG